MEASQRRTEGAKSRTKRRAAFAWAKLLPGETVSRKCGVKGGEEMGGMRKDVFETRSLRTEHIQQF